MTITGYIVPNAETNPTAWVFEFVLPSWVAGSGRVPMDFPLNLKPGIPISQIVEVAAGAARTLTGMGNTQTYGVVTIEIPI